MRNIDSFVFYRSYYEAIEKIPKECKLCMYEKIMEYAFKEHIKECTWELVDLVRWLVMPTLESSIQNRVNGKKWGRPKKEKTPLNNPPKKPQKKHPPKTNEDVNVYENEKDNDNDNEKENIDTTIVDSKAVQNKKDDLLSKFSSTSPPDQKVEIKSEAPKDFPAREIFWNPSVNEVIDAIKTKVEWYWLIYDWSMDRNFATHVNSKKLKAEADKYNCSSWLEYILYVIDASMQSDFRCWKICWPKSAYQKRAQVLNGFISDKVKEKKNVLPDLEAR